MKIDRRPDQKAILFTPAAEDDPEDLEDVVHDALAGTRPEPAAHPSLPLVILDFSGLPEAVFPRWMKAAGPEIPDANLRVVVGAKRLAVARALGLTFQHEWYGDLDDALRGGV